MKLGLQARLVLLFAAFGVLATGLTGVYAYRHARTLLVQAAERDLLTTTEMLGRRLTAATQRIGADARQAAQLGLARRVAAGQASAAEREMLADHFRTLLATDRRYFQARLIGAADHGLEIVRLDRDGADSVAIVGDALQEKAHFPYVFRTLQLKGDEVFLSKIGLYREAGARSGMNRPALQVASPVVDTAGRPIGVVVIGVDIERLFADLRTGLPGYLNLLLANEWGDFLIHPDAEQAFAFERGPRVLLQDAFPAAAPLFQGAPAAVLASAQLSDGQHSRQVLGAFVRLRLAQTADGADVVLGVAEPLGEILHSARTLGANILQIVLGFSVLAVALALLAARLVTRPLKQMTREVQRFAGERRMGDLPVRRRDEIGELARGFRQMEERVNASMSALQTSHERLAEQALRDPLTGLHNRTGFIERLEHAIEGARRQQQALALLFIDLDRFKQVNDLHGHAVGDRVLRQAALRLKHSVREADTVGRIGGDEFVILLEAVADERDAARVAEALIARFAEPVAVGGLEVPLGVSVGISVYPRDGADVASLMQRADEAMYRSKSGAGNRYSVFGDL